MNQTLPGKVDPQLSMTSPQPLVPKQHYTPNTDSQDLLFEIGTEELPPKALSILANALSGSVGTALKNLDLHYDTITTFATPRRLGFRISDLSTAQFPQEKIRRGPALTAAFDQAGNPTKAAVGFANSCGVTVAQLQREETTKGTWLIFRQTVSGQATACLLPKLIMTALEALPIPKRMRWGNSNVEFVRPVHWVVLLFGNMVVEAEILGVATGRYTRGHRFHHPETIKISEPKFYEPLLREQGWVEPLFVARRERIRTLVTEIATANDVTAHIEPDLLDEVTALCEWPVAIIGHFDANFLQVPTEALIETMQGHQKYFPVFTHDGRLAPLFITISNIVSLDPAQVRAGNERVIRPRFQDATFFWEQDRKQPLELYLQGLDTLVFQSHLGSMGDKVKRLAIVSVWIAEQLGWDINLVKRSALLCKCDLLTQMVGEFTNLQGIMGRYLATAEQESPCVAAAIAEHYLPRYAGDSLPQSTCGQALALADRLDNLVGIFAIGDKPTGVKDPYGLRRAALGVVRILIETPLHLDLRHLVQQAAAAFADKITSTVIIEDVVTYVLERLPNYYGEQSIRPDVVEAVVATGGVIPADIDRRIKALLEFKDLAEAASLTAAYKRTCNILRQVAKEDIAPMVRIEYLTMPAEQALYQRLVTLQPPVQKLFTKGDYGPALRELAQMRDDVDAFFDTVMVMVEDSSIRSNRLALLAHLAKMFGQVAEFSLLMQK